MKKKIGRKIYDTEKSEFIGRNIEGTFGDSRGFEEEMFKKGDGDFFLLVKGGSDSQYVETDILPLALDDAKEWINRVCGAEKLQEVVTEKDEKAAGLAAETVAKTAKQAEADDKKAASKTSASKTVTAKKTPAAKKPASKTSTSTAKKSTASKAKTSSAASQTKPSSTSTASTAKSKPAASSSKQSDTDSKAK